MSNDSEHRHEWQYAGETNDNDGEWYTKWACACGAYKIESMRIITDESGTFATGSDDQ